MIDLILEAVTDTLKLLPFLFLTYLVLEYMEHHTSDKTTYWMEISGKWGPAIGSVAGIFPQCGISAAASNLYAARVISMGTLIAVYLATSDEMLPILISERVSVKFVVQILLWKVICGMIVGFLIDFILFYGKKKEINSSHIKEMCEQEHCDGSKGILRSAIYHTVQVILFIFVITLILNLVIYEVGENRMGALLYDRPVAGVMISSLVGLIPNCGASVLITQAYLKGILGLGSMMAGLLTGAGTGLLVLFRMNKNAKENLTIVAILYGVGVLIGWVMNVVG